MGIVIYGYPPLKENVEKLSTMIVDKQNVQNMPWRLLHIFEKLSTIWGHLSTFCPFFESVDK